MAEPSGRPNIFPPTPGKGLAISEQLTSFCMHTKVNQNVLLLVLCPLTLKQYNGYV
jgi:hypothetical protein